MFGNISYDFIVGGIGSGDVNEVYIVLLVDGLNNVNVLVFELLKEVYIVFMVVEVVK